MSEQTAIVLKDYARSPEIMERFTEVVGKQNAGAYVQSVVLAAAMNTSLQQCDPKSIIASALRAASLRLSCDPSTGHAYLVPYKDKATLIVGYKGLYHLALRTGRYRYINVGRIYEGQEIVEDAITGNLRVEGFRASSKVIGYVGAFALLSGFAKEIYMTINEIHANAKRNSASYNRSDSAWKTNTEDMEKKTVLRRLLTHWGYLDPADAAIAFDEPNIEEATEADFYELPAPDETTPPEPAPKSNGKTADQITGELFGKESTKTPAEILAAAPPNGGNGHSPLVYTSPKAKLGKNLYPSQWVKLLVTYTRVNEFEVDGILQKLALPQETKPEDVVTAINNYLDAKE